MNYPYNDGYRQRIFEFSYKGEVLCFKDELTLDDDPEDCSFKDAFECEGSKDVEREVNAAFDVWARAWARKTHPYDRYTYGIGYDEPPLKKFAALVKGKVLRDEPPDYPMYDKDGNVIVY